MSRETVDPGYAHAYITRAVKSGENVWFEQELDIDHKLSKQPNIPKGREVRTTVPLTKIHVDISTSNLKKLIAGERDTQQNTAMRGVGISLEDSSIYNLYLLTKEERKEIITQMIDVENGSGFTQFRLCIGTPDYIRGKYFSYYDEIPTGTPDWDNQFSIQRDIDNNLINFIDEIKEVATALGVIDEIQFMASPWSPPGWMKENINSDIGNGPIPKTRIPFSDPEENQTNELYMVSGYLRDDCVDYWAIYLRRYLEEYAKLDIKITALTLQNEPTNDIFYFLPTCYQTAEQQVRVSRKLQEEIANSPILTAKGITPEIWAYDYTLQEVEDFIDKLNTANPGLSEFSGIALHDYLELGMIEVPGITPAVPPSDSNVIGKLKDRFPKLSMQLTERTHHGTYGAGKIIEYLRNGCESYIAWVLLLDQDKEPSTTNRALTKYGLAIRGNRSDKSYWFPSEVYIYGQFGRFIRPGCLKLNTELSEEDALIAPHVCYFDPINQNLIYVFSNKTVLPHRDLQISFGDLAGNTYTTILPADHVATYICNIR